MDTSHDKQLQQDVQGLRDDARFLRFLDWLKHERDKRDRENRVRGVENLTSEAEALTNILILTGHEPDPHVSQNPDETANAQSANGQTW